MEELRDLNQMAELAIARFSEYDGLDIELPQLFKDNVREIHSSSIKYNRYSAVIETKGYQNGTLNIYMPNQWFFIASYFTDLYNEMMKYKKYALQITTKERLKVLNGGTLTTEESDSLQSMDLSSTSKDYLSRFITDYSWWGGAKTIDRGDFYVSPILSHAKLVNASQSYVADLCAFLSDKQDLVGAILSNEESIASKFHPNCTNNILQRILYGAPGTGKSYSVFSAIAIHSGIINKDEKLSDGQRKSLEKADNIFRTTFHPDYDYAQFVGCYKPTKDEDGKITYDFTPQVFTNALVKAYEKPDESVYLVIEEINRGNCAQIFGDIFQLLDRNSEGESEYAINVDEDLRKYLEDQKIDGLINDGKIKLPRNFNIIATMNTSDQSLFPMDSAFKRRWEWQYVPIDLSDKVDSSKFEITIDGSKYKWHDFLKAVNVKIKDVTKSEDKQMGNFFIKKSVDAKEFCNKVMFYLWNDISKDYYESNDSLFQYKTGDGTKHFSFNELFGTKQFELLKGFMSFVGCEVSNSAKPEETTVSEEPQKEEDNN